MRVGVVDIGTNSTRMLIADVRDGRLVERDRRTRVTRLGQGVDATGTLHREAIERTLAVCDEYGAAIEAAGCERTIGVLTSAVRDAANGAEIVAAVRDRAHVDARTIDGAEEARLTFLGTTSDRDDPSPLVVVDIGGGSTELVVGRPGGEVEWQVSTQIGVVRHTERHLHDDPPSVEQVQALAADVRAAFAAVIPERVRSQPRSGIAVAGTPTSCAAIAQQLEPYDRARVEGFLLPLGIVEEQVAMLAAASVAQRRKIPGLHPDRAPTIVAGVVILEEAMRAFSLDAIEVSEHDILYGAALAAAAAE